jgi:uncharacterized protein (TIGR03067 family)
MRLLALVFGVALLAGSSSMTAADQQPRTSIPEGSEKAIEKAIRWLRQQQNYPTKAEMHNLQGTWRLVEAQMHGKKVAAKELPTTDISYKPHQLAIAGDKIVMHVNNGNTARGNFALDTTRKPKEMTIHWLIQWPAIFKLEGDMLTICFNEDANRPRPDEFRTLADSDRVLFIYERARARD